jgi:predicted nucleic acid-binding protein
MIQTLLDTGPLVAFLNESDQHHKWAIDQWASLPPPLLACEPVLTEACFLVQRNGGNPGNVLVLLQRGVLKCSFTVEQEASALETLMRRYHDTPMSLADACLVRLAELHQDCRLFTLDRDFTRYRRHGRQVIPLLAPW